MNRRWLLGLALLLVQSTGAEPLEPLWRALAGLDDGTRREPVVLIQLGDSHTANGTFTRHLRALFQQRFGAAGPGMLPPGTPYDYYRPDRVRVRQSKGWTVANSFRHAGLYGLSGYRLSSAQAGARLTIDSLEPGGFEQAALGLVLQPGGGSLRVVIDRNAPQTLSSNAATRQAVQRRLAVPAGSRTLTVTVRGDGPVELLSWTLQRQRPGVVLDSHGVVGATVNLLGRWDEAALATDLAFRQPALLLVAFGTNEGFKRDVTAAGYRRDFAARLGRLRTLAPDAALVVLGPPDGNRLHSGCSARQTRECSLTPGSGCQWQPPPLLATVREIQRTHAAESGNYFWDWSQVMGGACGIHRWAQAEPSLAYPDHVHLREAGYERSAQALFTELMTGYARYRAQHPP